MVPEENELPGIFPGISLSFKGDRNLSEKIPEDPPKSRKAKKGKAKGKKGSGEGPRKKGFSKSSSSNKRTENGSRSSGKTPKSADLMTEEQADFAWFTQEIGFAQAETKT